MVSFFKENIKISKDRGKRIMQFVHMFCGHVPKCYYILIDSFGGGRSSCNSSTRM